MALRVIENLSNQDVGILPNMVNVIWEDIWNPWLQIELYVSFQKKTKCTWSYPESDLLRRKQSWRGFLGPTKNKEFLSISPKVMIFFQFFYLIKQKDV